MLESRVWFWLVDIFIVKKYYGITIELHKISELYRYVTIVIITILGISLFGNVSWTMREKEHWTLNDSYP